MNTLETVFVALRTAQAQLALENREAKDRALQGVIDALDANRQLLCKANEADIAKARNAGMKAALIDRLALDAGRIDAILQGIATVIQAEDPIGKVRARWTLSNGLVVEQRAVALGVAAIIYESRPNVTVDAFSLAYKAGCAILLRGSSSALESNRALVRLVKQGLEAGGGISEAVALAQSGSREEVAEILNARGKLDVVIPRGGRDLIRRVVREARLPVLETGEGNCHIYVEPSADMPKAVDIIENAKVQKPGACNAVETVVVHRDAAASLMPLLARRLAGTVELRCDEAAKQAIGTPPLGLVLKDAVNEDWETEFLDYILAVKTVESFEEAIEFINRYGTKHSEAILTQDLAAAEAFTRRIDAACVYTNASTRFTDGGVFGFGAELGISTQKFHARGPMGLEALTTIQYCVAGSGQIRA
ncbi:MAG: glutamate-5-semialdehyde dehydrogenase [Spirochaetaceae bacterium]|jgi:glutamate-5-semialdehyde dehydrogenase|nr:glutamate-5-semialdehyde dehydrogenase [Spirochaetaceae bacterium]